MNPPTAQVFSVTSYLFAGKYPGAQSETEASRKIDKLVRAGVRMFVDLTEEGELRPYAHLLPAGVQHRRIAVRDVSAPSVDQVREALAAIASTPDGGVAYLHCRGGCGRTGVIVGCYLVEQGLPPDEALKRVNELTRPLRDKPCPETPTQLDRVRGWPSSEPRARSDTPTPS